MKKRLSKILSVTLALLMVCSMCLGSAFAAGGDTEVTSSAESQETSTADETPGADETAPEAETEAPAEEPAVEEPAEEAPEAVEPSAQESAEDAPAAEEAAEDVPAAEEAAEEEPELDAAAEPEHDHSDASLEWNSDGSELRLVCPVCDEVVYSAYLEEPEEEFLICTGWDLALSAAESERFSSEVSLMYEGTDDTEYDPTAKKPTKSGTYEAWLECGDVQTDPVSFTLKSHAWEYSAEGYALLADCVCCGESASVTINTTTIYEASRNYENHKGDLKYEVFYDNNWSCQQDIVPYEALYSGFVTNSPTSTTVYDRVWEKPNSTGSYNVRLSLLSDPEDPDTAYLSTMEKPFYLADLSIYDVSLLNYGQTEILQFTQPNMISGFYQVGTLSELLWCLYNKNCDANISLINDIVVNPITVTDAGLLRAARYQVYEWDGFGTERSPYTGTFLGNGHTIYGLYHPNANTHYSGLIDYGADCTVKDVTVESAYLYDTDAAGICGRYSAHTGVGTFSNCSTLNCYITAKNCAGGILAYYYADNTSNYDTRGVDILDCGNSSRVIALGSCAAGGIVGWVNNCNYMHIERCWNTGHISSASLDAGGILGKAYLEHWKYSTQLWIRDCFNTGRITSVRCGGGIAGFIDYETRGCNFKVTGCTSTGYIDSAGGWPGGIMGIFENDTDYSFSGFSNMIDVSNNYYYDAPRSYLLDSADIADATKLTQKQSKTFICSLYGHKEASHWNSDKTIADCTHDGKLTLLCAICGSTLEENIIPAHGHRYEYSVCMYCGQYEDDEAGYVGSVFGETLLPAGICAALLVIAAAAVLIVRKKKKKKAEEE